MRAYLKGLPVILVAVAGACGPSDRKTADQDTLVVTTTTTDSVGRSRVVDTTTGAVDSGPTGSAKGDPDVKGVEHWRNLDPKRPAARDANHQFLRTMADHNEGMVEMVALAKDRAADSTTIREIGRLRDARGRMRTELIDMIRAKYQEVFVPVASPVHNDRLDSLDLTKPAEFDREFYQRALEHHRQWIRSIDSLSPKLTDAGVKAFATRLRAELQGDVDTFMRRLPGAGG
ncbi:MAG TPA: DUF4142 domain-containing protein [Gemmatimonadaceae bacterium]